MTSSSELPPAPGTTSAHETADTDTTYAAPAPATAKRDWRRMGRSRKVLTAGAVVAGLAIGGAGFGAGYAVGDDGAATTGTTSQTPGDFGGRGGPMGDRDGDGDLGGQFGVPPGGQLGGGTDPGGTTGEAPDFDGDSQPDTDSGTTQQS